MPKKRPYQFHNFLTQVPNSKGSYTLGKKSNTHNSQVQNGQFDNNFYVPKNVAINYQWNIELLPEYGATDIDFVLDQLSNTGSKLKKVFFISPDPENRSKIYWNYAYTDNEKISVDEMDYTVETEISMDIKLKTPDFFECDRDLSILDPALLNGIVIRGYDNNATYNGATVYDSTATAYVKADTLSDANVNNYLNNPSSKYLLSYSDFFNVANQVKRELVQSIAQRRDSKTLIIPLSSAIKISTSTDRSSVALGSSYPAGWTGGKLDLSSNKPTEVMVLELDSNGMPTNYWIKITNLENNSYIKITWKSTQSLGQSGQIQVYPHVSKVYANGILANPLTDYTVEVDPQYSSLYFDKFVFNPTIPSQLGQQTSQSILVEQSQTIPSTLYLQTLKSFL